MSRRSYQTSHTHEVGYQHIGSGMVTQRSGYRLLAGGGSLKSIDDDATVQVDRHAASIPILALDFQTAVDLLICPAGPVVLIQPFEEVCQ